MEGRFEQAQIAMRERSKRLPRAAGTHILLEAIGKLYELQQKRGIPD